MQQPLVQKRAHNVEIENITLLRIRISNILKNMFRNYQSSMLMKLHARTGLMAVWLKMFIYLRGSGKYFDDHTVFNTSY